MTDTTMVPFYKSFLLGQTVYLDQIQGLPVRDLELLNVDTLAALEEARDEADRCNLTSIERIARAALKGPDHDA